MNATITNKGTLTVEKGTIINTSKSDTIYTVYNSKTFSILPNDFNLDFARIDILHEDIDKINEIITKVKNNERFEGKEFTNGNLKREI